MKKMMKEQFLRFLQKTRRKFRKTNLQDWNRQNKKKDETKKEKKNWRGFTERDEKKKWKTIPKRNMKVLCLATKKKRVTMRRVDKERGNIREGTYKEGKHEKRVKKEKETRNISVRMRKINMEIRTGRFFVDKEYQKWDWISGEKGICFEKCWKTKRMRRNEIFCGKRSKQKEKWQKQNKHETYNFCFRKTEKWLQEGKKQGDAHKEKEKKKRIRKDRTEEIKDKWRKTVKKKKINGGEKQQNQGVSTWG